MKGLKINNEINYNNNVCIIIEIIINNNLFLKKLKKTEKFLWCYTKYDYNTTKIKKKNKNKLPPKYSLSSIERMKSGKQICNLIKMS